MGGNGVDGRASDSVRVVEEVAGAVEAGCSLPWGSTASMPCWAIMAA